MTMSYELQELRNVFHGLETVYSTYLPKVDPVLIHDILLREEQKSERAPFYMVEVFTKPGTNSEWCKQHITETTGFVPAIYDKGTHYVTNMRLTLDILKRLNDFEFVEEIAGDYILVL
jgi:hypothetical protein